MRLDELYIGEFKNLRDLHVDFDAGSPYTVIVGENGAGKSNLLEALTLIFRQLDLGRPAPFDYRLSYRCRDHDVKIEASGKLSLKATQVEISGDATVKVAGQTIDLN